jgi:hypothetical protein
MTVRRRATIGGEYLRFPACAGSLEIEVLHVRNTWFVGENPAAT